MTPIRSFKPQPTGRTIADAGKTHENHTWRGGASGQSLAAQRGSASKK